MKGHRGRGAAPVRLIPVRLIAALVACGLGISACGGSASSSGQPAAPTSTTLAAPPVQITASVTDGATDVPIDGPLSVTVTDGELADVTLSVTKPLGADSSAPVGARSPDNLSWQLDSGLAPRTGYTLTAVAVDRNGSRAEHSYRFTTGEPVDELHTNLSVTDGGTYGVGMPIVVKLNHPVAEAKHAALTERLQVTTDRPITGGWRWFSDSEVHWRPEVYWPTGTKVSLKIDFAGFDAGNGVWGSTDGPSRSPSATLT